MGPDCSLHRKISFSVDESSDLYDRVVKKLFDKSSLFKLFIFTKIESILIKLLFPRSRLLSSFRLSNVSVTNV